MSRKEEIQRPLPPDIYSGIFPAHVQKSSGKKWCIKIGEKVRLEDAVELHRDLSKKIPRAKLIPHWNQNNGLKFIVISKRLFVNETSAKGHFKNLPALVAEKAVVMPLHSENTIFFNNPFN